MAKTASKLDWLRKRPDMQTPEGLRMLRLLDHHKQEVGEKLDPLLPWITREWKRGRLIHDVDAERADLPRYDSEGKEWYAPYYGDLYAKIPNEPDAMGDNPGWHRESLTDARLSHWADWYNHPLGRGTLDMGSKQFQVPQMLDAVNGWNERMKEEAEKAQVKEQADAPILHQWDDGWKLQDLEPKHLEYEGDVMGHCVGGYDYADAVRNGTTKIVSLRDPAGRPHATAELELHRGSDSTQPGCPSCGAPVYPDENGQYACGEGNSDGIYPGCGYSGSNDWGAYRPINTSLANAKIVQIQGKSDSVPIPEYQQRFKDWFQTFPEDKRPNWDYSGGHIRHIGDLVDDRNEEADDEGDWAEGGYGPHGDYGLVKPERPIDYGSVLQSLPYDRHAPSGYPTMVYREGDGRTLYNQAVARGEIPQFTQALERYHENIAMPAYEDHEEQNFDYYPPYPGESYDEEPERWAEPDPNYYSWGDDREPEQRFNDAREAYEDAERQKLENVPEMQATSHLYTLLNQHQFDPQTGTYMNELKGSQPGTFSKTGNFLHHYNPWTGKRCYCPWGKHKSPNRRIAGQELNRLLKSPDKRLNSPEGQQFTESLKDMLVDNPDADSLAPWLAQRWKKGDFHYHPGSGAYYYPTWPNATWDDELDDTARPNYRWDTVSGSLPEWSQWFEARQHPTRRGVNVMDPSFDVHAMNVKAEEHQEALARQQQVEDDLSYGDVVKRWPDGWHIRHLNSNPVDSHYALQGEGDAMGHCIGNSSDPDYSGMAENGDIDVFSLRDKQGWPHATWHTNSRSNGGVAEVFGREDSNLKPEYQDRYEQWCRDNNISSYPEGNQDAYPEGNQDAYDQIIGLPAADDVQSYLDLHSDEGDPWEYIPEDANAGEDTELEYENPDLGGIARDMYNQNGYNPPTDERRRHVFDTAVQQGHFPALNDEMDDPLYNDDPDDPEGKRIWQQWQKWAEPYYHPMTGQFIRPGYGEKPIAEQFQSPLFQEPTCRNCGQTGQHASWCRAPQPQPLDFQYPQYQQPAYLEWQPPDNSAWEIAMGRDPNGGPNSLRTPQPLTYAKVASTPLYYRWCFSPSSGEVTLAHNFEDEQRSHGDLARERNEPGLVHGYAYRIGGGWRITDWESHLVADPFITAQVMRALRGDEDFNPKGREITGRMLRWDSTHHGIPREDVFEVWSVEASE